MANDSLRGFSIVVVFLVVGDRILPELFLMSFRDQPIQRYALRYYPVLCQLFKPRVILEQNVEVLRDGLK